MHPITNTVPSGLAYSLSSLINQHFNRKEAKKAREEQHALTKELEGKRRELQKEQMMLSILHQHSNQEHQRALAIENQKFQAILQRQNHEFQKEIEEFRQKVNLAINERNIEFQKWRFLQEKELQLHIVELNQQFQRELIVTQHQNAKDLIYEAYRVNKENPILNLAKDLIEAPFLDGIVPLKILFSPPELDIDPHRPQPSKGNIESYLAAEIRQFINQGYGINSKERSTEFLDKAWQSKKFGGGSAVNTLHNWLKSNPVLILESGFAQNKINLQYWSWDGSQTSRSEGSLLHNFSFIDFVKTLAKEKARQRRADILKLRQAGMSDEGLTDEAELKNIAVLEQEEKAIAELEESTFATEDKTRYIKQKQKYYLAKYTVTKDDESAFYDYLVVLHCLAIGLTVDLFALQRSCKNYPLLPKLLPNLFGKLRLSPQQNQQAISEVVKLYHQFYENLTTQPEHNSFVPDLALDLAFALSNFEDKSLAVEEARYSVAQWLDLHGLEAGKVFNFNEESDRQLLKSIIFQEDNAYFEKLQQVAEKIGSVADDSFAQVQSLLDGWLSLKRWSTIPSIAAVKEAKTEEKTAEQTELKSADSTDGLSTFSFETVTVDKQGEIIKRETKSAHYYTEILPGGIELDMVLVPGGSFTRVYSSDSKQVWISPFYMSKYPITQEQWRAVTNLPEVNGTIDSDISGFKNDLFPVEQVSYYEAEEFCCRLTKATNSYYRLPSESQWEYACRAGTTTPFQFGETLTGELANFDSREEIDIDFYELNDQSKLLSIAKEHNLTTSIVGSFFPNSFGLYDMHGNVWEWCADPAPVFPNFEIHSDRRKRKYYFDFAPIDGSIWENDNYLSERVIKGGSWISGEYGCSSELRRYYNPNSRFRRNNKKIATSVIGFRVICFLPRFSESFF